MPSVPKYRRMLIDPETLAPKGRDYRASRSALATATA
jgi:hypothetical protein